MIRPSGTRMYDSLNNQPRLSRAVVAFTGVLAILLVVSAFAQSPMDATVPPSIPVDRATIERLYGPNKNDTRGALSESGSYVHGAQLVREGFALKDVADGGAFAEVVSFPKGYRYAMHDLFGSLLQTAAYDEKLSGAGDLAAAVKSVRCIVWEFEDGVKGGNVCYARVGGRKIPEGVVAWVQGNTDDGVVTVRVAYQHPSGHFPGQVIDKYLRDYPSDVPANPTWHVDWETKDIEKWTEQLRAYKDDVPMLQAGAAYLMRYDKRSFGLLDALKKRDDAVAFSTALDGVVERMNRVVAERKAKAREPGRRGD